MSFEGNRAELAQELAENYYRYAEGLDSKNWELVRSCFADEVYIDYGPVIDPDGSADTPRAADEWLKVLQGAINGFDATRHLMSNPRVEVTGDEVTCRIYLQADHVIYPIPEMAIAGPHDVATVIGEYTNSYVQTPQGWKICKSKLVMDYTTGNLELFGAAAGRVAALSQ
jgi:3-phenylpropionate/cinnamic acid dioxygenase small subunit